MEQARNPALLLSGSARRRATFERCSGKTDHPHQQRFARSRPTLSAIDHIIVRSAQNEYLRPLIYGNDNVCSTRYLSRKTDRFQRATAMFMRIWRAGIPIFCKTRGNRHVKNEARPAVPRWSGASMQTEHARYVLFSMQSRVTGRETYRTTCSTVNPEKASLPISVPDTQRAFATADARSNLKLAESAFMVALICPHAQCSTLSPRVPYMIGIMFQERARTNVRCRAGGECRNGRYRSKTQLFHRAPRRTC